jgi:hypothetical protein
VEPISQSDFLFCLAAGDLGRGERGKGKEERGKGCKAEKGKGGD